MLLVVVVLRVALRVASGSRLGHQATSSGVGASGGGVVVLIVVLVASADHALLLQNHNRDLALCVCQRVCEERGRVLGDGGGNIQWRGVVVSREEMHSCSWQLHLVVTGTMLNGGHALNATQCATTSMH